ncbi:MAG: 30S ribosomal protein S13 [Fervidicoccaceae archaeon]
MSSSSQQFRHIVRVAGVDLEGKLDVVHGLASIKGIGVNLAAALVRRLGMDPTRKIGELTDAELATLEDAVLDPSKYGVPSWMLNRRKDYESGEDLHLVGADLIFKVRQDIEREKKIKSWRGIRHALGLKVRGQRTATTGRFGPTVGVKKSKAKK